MRILYLLFITIFISQPALAQSSRNGEGSSSGRGSSKMTVEVSTFIPAPHVYVQKGKVFDTFIFNETPQLGLSCTDFGALKNIEGLLHFCNKSGLYAPLSSSWAQVGDNVFPADINNTDLKVGIKTDTPETELDVEGTILADQLHIGIKPKSNFNPDARMHIIQKGNEPIGLVIEKLTAQGPATLQFTNGANSAVAIGLSTSAPNKLAFWPGGDPQEAETLTLDSTGTMQLNSTRPNFLILRDLRNMPGDWNNQIILSKENYPHVRMGTKGNGSHANFERFFISTDYTAAEPYNTPDFVIDKIGNAGIGIVEPKAKLDVGGNIKVGFDDVACNNSGRNGSIRYNPTQRQMEYCDGTGWQNFYPEGQQEWQNFTTSGRRLSTDPNEFKYKNNTGLPIEVSVTTKNSAAGGPFTCDAELHVKKNDAAPFVLVAVDRNNNPSNDKHCHVSATIPNGAWYKVRSNPSGGGAELRNWAELRTP